MTIFNASTAANGDFGRKIMWAARLTDRPTLYTHAEDDDRQNLVLPTNYFFFKLDGI